MKRQKNILANKYDYNPFTVIFRLPARSDALKLQEITAVAIDW